MPNAAPGVYYQVPCERPPTREDAAYCDQRRATVAAESQAKWALGQFWVGLGGIAALLFTLLYTARAATAAKEAADAALKGVLIAELAHERDRARISVNTDKSVGVDRDADGIHLGTVVSFDIVNTGVATATIEAVAIKVDAGQGCIPKIDDIIGSLSKINPYRMIPQGGSETLRAGIVSTMAEFIAAGADVFLIGAIRYRDPTLGSFVRGFCFWQVGRGWISVGGEQYHFDVPWEQFCMATAESHADT